MPSEDRSDLGIFYPIVGHMCHIPVVEVDVETGKIDFLDYVAVHDCGTMVNPMTLAWPRSGRHGERHRQRSLRALPL